MKTNFVFFFFLNVIADLIQRLNYFTSRTYEREKSSPFSLLNLVGWQKNIGLISYLSAWGSDRRVLLKNTTQPDNEVYLCKMVPSRDVLRLTKALVCPWAEIGKYWPGKEAIRLQDSLLCPPKKKIIVISTAVFFLSFLFQEHTKFRQVYQKAVYSRALNKS